MGISKLKLGAGVLLDEPFSHLSPIRVQEMNILIREASKQKGILISDHYYEESYEPVMSFMYCRAEK
ncbi:hypothetical protein [Pedobacter antarcticus]|uniref:hypothetical protein n=1 Tax=Pedobacter antarcticus TaxID=34086 RepID=UPI00292F4B2D|nr:hypothetical protein [Pedobacter antarcticus]